MENDFEYFSRAIVRGLGVCPLSLRRKKKSMAEVYGRSICYQLEIFQERFRLAQVDLLERMENYRSIYQNHLLDNNRFITLSNNSNSLRNEPDETELDNLA